MLDLSSDGSISLVYPQAGVEEVLKPNQKLTRTLTTFVPAGRDRDEDVLKVFGSYKPIKLSVLEQPNIRDPGEPLQQLLAESAGGTRGVSADQAPPMALSEWAVAQRLLVVNRK